MSNKQEFIQYVETTLSAFNMSEGAQKYYEVLKSVQEREKPLFTDNGKLILNYLKENTSVGEAIAAKKIAEGLEVSSRTVSGAIRKLVSDEYVEKVSTDPVLYAITDKGANVDF